MLKSFKFMVSYTSVQNFRVINSFSPLLTRLLHNGKFRSDSGDEETREQFNGPIPIESLKIKYSRSPGPGGQNVNKEKVQNAEYMYNQPHYISAKPSGDQAKIKQESSRINKEGELVLQSSRYRNQQKNLMDGVQKLREILENVSIIPNETSEEKKAKITEMIKSNHERRLKEKKSRSRTKQDRSRNE